MRYRWITLTALLAALGPAAETFAERLPHSA
jgi:hypothetical protein